MSRDADGDEFVGFTPEEPTAAATPETVEVTEVEPEEGEGAEEPEVTPEVNDEAEEGDDEPEKGKRNKPAHKRIDELTKARREAERRAEAAEQELARLRGETPQQEAPAELKEPSPDDFEFGEADPAYLRALAKYEVKVELAQERAAQAQHAEQQAFTARAAALDTSWKEQSEKASERYEDFNEAIADYQANEPCPPILAMAIQASDHGADVAYHLAKNPKENAELARLAQTDPLEAARRFGRLEARFESKPEAKPQPKRVTEAPEPPRHRARGGSGQFAPDFSDDNADLDKIYREISR